MPNTEEGYYSNRGVGNKQCTIIDYVDDLLMTCKNKVTIVGAIKALTAKYHDVQERTVLRLRGYSRDS